MSDKSIDFYKKIAKESFSLKKYDEALLYLKTAEFLFPNDMEIKKAIVETNIRLKDFSNAKNYIEKIIEKEPSCTNYFVLGKIYYEFYEETSNCEYLKESYKNTKTAYEKDKTKKIYLKNLIILCLNLKYKDEYEKYWMEYVKFKDFDIEDVHNLGIYYLRKGDYKKGFELLECRFDNTKDPVFYPKFDKPKYKKGEDLTSKTLLLQFEQGFGDVFMFSRLLPEIKKMANKVILRVPSCMSNILKRNFPFVEIICQEDDLNIEYDYHLPFMSIPYVLGLEKKDIPVFEKYIYEDEELALKYKDFLDDKNFKVGIAYNPNPYDCEKRKCLRKINLKEFSAFTEIEGASVYSLQYGADDIVFQNTKIKNLSPYIKDFDDTAAIIQNMDLIVTTDNVILNLSGALGKKTFGLLNLPCDWRWLDIDGKENPWYKSVQYLQVKSINNFTPLIQEIKEKIEKMIN